MKSKNICVLGIGKSGIAVANLAVKLGYNVFVSDNSKKIEANGLNQKIEVEIGEHSNKILNSDIIIKSPGIDSNIPILKKAREKKIKIISELAFSLDFLKNLNYKKIIAITGTNGKTTTTDLVSKIMMSTYKNLIVSGNIGSPLANDVFKVTKETYIIIEVSSYQLEDTPQFKPNVSVLLNITPDHFEHHKNMKLYIDAKKKVFINQKHNDFTIINYDNRICRKIIPEIKTKKIFFSKHTLKQGVFYNNGNIIIKIDDKHIVIKPTINILGRHNIDNILAAVATAHVVGGIKPKSIEKVISNYECLEHRIEFVRILNGVSYYNDSKSTNVDSTKVAVKSFKHNILLIMGGSDKYSSFNTLKNIVKKRVKFVFLIGASSNKIRKDLIGTTVLFNCKTMENAINKIYKIAKKGDVVLLSPACASFDQFRNFEERGIFFKQLVNKL
ncbi:MAG: UDP-N-acetylmuramoyl-L-alanine--D-glutamate ligase [Endomicrobium sp.]|nr:UDP-N-acetylmuramoyl-L-alanine--D-glutamate ligase [Endomicrobium sp.]